MQVSEKVSQKYNIGDKIGSGFTSVVYKVTNKKTEKNYALKIINKRHEEIVSNAEKEIFLHSKLNNPHIVKLIESFEDDNNFYIILELCGDNAYEYMKNNNPVDENYAINMIYQIALAVKYLHDNNMTHRDIKLENIVKCGSFWKLADFGSIDTEKFFRIKAGTLDYLAPEIVASKKYKGFHVDIWTLGVTLYDLLFRHPPFLEKTYKATYDAIKNNEVSFKDRSINSLTKDLIVSMLNKDPDQRININQVLSHPVFKLMI
mgnify:CR=1 FL=1